MAPSKIVIKLLLAIPLLVAALPGQDSTPLFRTNSRLVLLDVVVTDKAGHPIGGLTKSDFTVLEDGTPQQIQSFEASTSPAASTSTRVGYGARTLLLLDQLNIQFQDLAYARDQMALFLKQHPVAQQPTALMAIGRRGLAMLQDFTQDGKILDDKLARLPALLANPVDGYSDPLLAEEHAREALRALAQIANAAVGYPFRLNVIWITSGFPGTLTSPSATGQIDSRLHRLENLLIRSRMSLYTIDPSGVIQESGLISLNPAKKGKGREVLQDATKQFSHATTNPQLSADKLLSELTRLMGGLSYFNRNDVDRALSQAIEDGSSAYAITYSPSNTDFQGRYRKIEIQMKVEGATARTRLGYYALPDEAAAEAVSRDDRLQIALESPLPYAAFVVACPMVYDSASRRLHGKLSSRPQIQMRGSDQTQQIVLATAVSEREKVLSKWSWQINWKTSWTDKPVGTLFDKVLPEGARRVRFVISDASAERIGTCDWSAP